MEILSYAKEIEEKSIKHYSRLAEEENTKEISSIFSFLAREEEQHYKIFDAWQKNEKIPDFDDLGLLGHAKKVFKDLSKQFDTKGVPAFDRDDAYEKALTFENKSVSVYTEALQKASEGVDNESQKNILKRIIEEEKKHAQLIKSLMEFQRHPGEWLEDAEWNHFDEF